ncbi:hypothetical protein Tco_0035018 [Tanacetum coccineum]
MKTKKLPPFVMVRQMPVNDFLCKRISLLLYFAFMIADISNDQIGSIKDASLNPEIRDDAGSSMSPKLKKRVIKVQPDLNVNIARGRDQKTPKSIFYPSGKKRKPHVRGIPKKKGEK